MSYLLNPGNFRVTLTRTEEGLLIEAENLSSFDLLSKTIDDKSISTVTGGRFLDIDTISERLKDFFENRSFLNTRRGPL